jgi:hypothetical protein
MPERIEAMGADEVPEDFIWESSKDLFNRVGRAGSSGVIAPRRDLLKIAERISSVRGTITPQHFDRPLHLAELVRVSTPIRMEPTDLRPIRRLDGGLGRPTATEPRRMDADVLESQDAERGPDPLRLQVELP